MNHHPEVGVALEKVEDVRGAGGGEVLVGWQIGKGGSRKQEEAGKERDKARQAQDNRRSKPELVVYELTGMEAEV
jgi:hypothetical protein